MIKIHKLEDGDIIKILPMIDKDNKISLAKLLISKGCDINAADKDGENALHVASKEGHKDIVKLLIEKGIKK